MHFYIYTDIEMIPITTVSKLLYVPELFFLFSSVLKALVLVVQSLL